MKPYALNPTFEYRDVREMLNNSAAVYGDDIAYSYRVSPKDSEAVRVSFRTLLGEVDDLAAALVELGCHGKHCAIIGKLTYPWIKVYYALLSIGAVVVPLDRDWTGSELSTTAAFADCEFVFADEDLKDKVDMICQNEECHILGRFVIGGEGEDSVAALEIRDAAALPLPWPPARQCSSVPNFPRSTLRFVPRLCSPRARRARERALCCLKRPL